MNLFRRKHIETEEEVSVPVFQMPHEHTWKDMPWYMGKYYNGRNNTAGYKIVEPYICITCGERKDVTLEKEDYSDISAEEREDIFRKVRNRYKKYLKPRAIVEDMINNILLVKDPSRLNMIEVQRGTPHRNCGSSSEMKTTDKDIGDFKIIIPEREKR